jgi:hypothetical protein
MKTENVIYETIMFKTFNGRIISVDKIVKIEGIINNKKIIFKKRRKNDTKR